jgi:hypothetical protein
MRKLLGTISYEIGCKSLTTPPQFTVRDIQFTVHDI